jgi:uncharacterized membrane protein
MAEKKEMPAGAKPAPAAAAKPAAAPKPATGGGKDKDSNLIAALGYIIGILAIIMYFVKKDDRFVRFHALQSIFLWVGYVVIAIGLTIVATVLSFVPVLQVLACIPGMLTFVAVLVAGVAALYAAYKTFNGVDYEMPYIGPMARKYV